jgi:predicted RNase H-like nuclease (RuvC/YqgF family)
MTADDSDTGGQRSQRKKHDVLAAATAAKVGKSPRKKNKKNIEKLNKIDEFGEEIRDVESINSDLDDGFDDFNINQCDDPASVDAFDDVITPPEAHKDQKIQVMIEKQQELEVKMQKQLEEIEQLKGESERMQNAEGRFVLLSLEGGGKLLLWISLVQLTNSDNMPCQVSCNICTSEDLTILTICTVC